MLEVEKGAKQVGINRLWGRAARAPVPCRPLKAHQYRHRRRHHECHGHRHRHRHCYRHQHHRLI